MPLTPADVHNIAFKKPSIGKRGYDGEQVDAFLDELEEELIRLIEENNELRTRMAFDGAWAGADAGPQLAALDDVTAQFERAQREKAAAEQAARATQAQLEQARTLSGPVTARDREQEFQVLTMAERTADTHLGEAQREAHGLLSNARSAARQLTDDAQAKADALERDARQRHHEAMGGLSARRTAARQEIEDLEAFEREYRTRLRAYVESQLRDQEGRGHGPDGSGEVES
ncbi:DivIVA domain-containing protein [Micromonospora sp. CPCC 205371]|nr:DivIVA domain-containing protein [Micromonospora sp. CPCC 205371]